MLDIEEIMPLVFDIKDEYVKLRRMGKGRDEVVGEILESYQEELQDMDDRVAIMMGLTRALCRKKELTREIAAETLSAMQAVRENWQPEDVPSRQFDKLTAQLKDESMYGDEAKYPLRRLYVPDWKVGDTFAHTLTCSRAEELGIAGWTVILRKAYEHVDTYEEYRQLMYISLCPPGKEPKTSAQLQELGYLPTFYEYKGKEYLGQIMITSKRVEKGYGLTKIGCFPDVLPPADQLEENPLVAMPLFGLLRRDDLWPAYEDTVCLMYWEYMKRKRSGTL